MRGRLQNFKKIETQVDETQNKANDILWMIGQLFQMRIVERMCRPIPYLQKQQIFTQFKQKFIYLHQMMRQLQKEYLQENGAGTQRGKSHTKTNINNRCKYQKEQIRRIQNRYTEVFIQGSFRYYYRAAKASGLPTDLEVINIEEWTEQTLKEDAESKCC